MPSPTQDRAYLAAGLDALESYLLSDELFHYIGGEFPRLTISGLLLSGKRIEEMSSRTEQESSASRLLAARMRWRSAWQRKCTKEFHARLQQWQQALQEVLDYDGRVTYSQEVQWRVMLQLLINEIESPVEDIKVLDDLDDRLRSRWKPGEFIWNPSYRKAFNDDYWFLYGSIIHE